MTRCRLCWRYGCPHGREPIRSTNVVGQSLAAPALPDADWRDLSFGLRYGRGATTARMSTYAQRDAFYSRMIYRPTEEPTVNPKTHDLPADDVDYKHTDADGDWLKVERSSDRDETVAYVETTPIGVYVDKAAAPAAALALLKAAGWEGLGYTNVAQAVRALARHEDDEAEEAEKAKAAELAKLDAEADRLRLAFVGLPSTSARPWADTNEATKRAWRRAAEAARA